jgi:hypothetical protein
MNPACTCAAIKGSRLLLSALPPDVVRQVIHPLSAWPTTSLEQQVQAYAIKLWQQIPPQIQEPFRRRLHNREGRDSIPNDLEEAFAADLDNASVAFQAEVDWETMMDYVLTEDNAGRCPALTFTSGAEAELQEEYRLLHLFLLQHVRSAYHRHQVEPFFAGSDKKCESEYTDRVTSTRVTHEREWSLLSYYTSDTVFAWFRSQSSQERPIRYSTFRRGRALAKRLTYEKVRWWAQRHTAVTTQWSAKKELEARKEADAQLEAEYTAEVERYNTVSAEGTIDSAPNKKQKVGP